MQICYYIQRILQEKTVLCRFAIKFAKILLEKAGDFIKIHSFRLWESFL